MLKKEAKQLAPSSLGRILDAAEAAFSVRGYDGTTFSDICVAAGVSRGLPSYLFGSKEGLYRKVVERAAQRLRDAVIGPLRSSANAVSIEEAISLIVHTYVDYLEANPRIVRLLQWEMLSDPSDGRPFAPSSALFADLLEILKAVLGKGARSEVDAAALLGSLVGLCFFPSMLRGRVKALGRLSVRQRKRHIVELLLHGVT